MAEIKNGRLVHAQVAEALDRGLKVFVGMYHAGDAQVISGRGGKVFKKARHSVLAMKGPEITHVNEWLPDEMDVAGWKTPFSRGDMVMGVVAGQDSTSGASVVVAKLTRLDP
jgi:hypothetical protein